MDLETKIVFSKIQGGFICVFNDKEHSFESYEDVQKNEEIMNYSIDTIIEKDGKIVITMIKDSVRPPVFDEKEEWVKQYIKQFGTEPSFF